MLIPPDIGIPAFAFACLIGGAWYLAKKRPELSDWQHYSWSMTIGGAGAILAYLFYGLLIALQGVQ